MKRQRIISLFVKRVRNQKFRALFLKKWIAVFLSILIPLILSVFCVIYFSQKSLQDEVDTSVKRGTNNTAIILNTVFDEVCTTLEKEVLDDDVTSFFSYEYSLPVNYDFIYAVRSVLNRLSGDYRANLYASMDVYSELGDYIVSYPDGGQVAQRSKDKTLVQVFETKFEKGDSQVWFAASRLRARTYMNDEQEVITIYRSKSPNNVNKSFVSVSLDIKKIIEHITNNLTYGDEIYLILDKDNQVVMDTARQHRGVYMKAVERAEDVIIETDMNGDKVWLFCVPLKHFQWKLVQIVPMDTVQENNMKLRQVMLAVVILGVVITTFLSYGVTSRLYYPIEVILNLIENPSEQIKMTDEKGEVQYLLLSIVELFQKNMVLEQEMVSRVTALRNARAKALQEQMTPHFLYNVLQSINWLAIEDTGCENSATSRSILLLADIIRTTKEKVGNLTTVKEEIQYTRKFVELERLRYGKNIQCNYFIEQEVEEMSIPCISLQTLVENAIRHGLQPRNACGNISILIQRHGIHGLFLRVEDDGVGISEQAVRQIFETLENEYIYVGNHVGIVNLFQRFRLIYGNNCKFNIKNNPNGGTCVEILLPELPEW